MEEPMKEYVLWCGRCKKRKVTFLNDGNAAIWCPKHPTQMLDYRPQSLVKL